MAMRDFGALRRGSLPLCGGTFSQSYSVLMGAETLVCSEFCLFATLGEFDCNNANFGIVFAVLFEALLVEL